MTPTGLERNAPEKRKVFHKLNGNEGVFIPSRVALGGSGSTDWEVLSPKAWNAVI